MLFLCVSFFFWVLLILHKRCVVNLLNFGNKLDLLLLRIVYELHIFSFGEYFSGETFKLSTDKDRMCVCCVCNIHFATLICVKKKCQSLAGSFAVKQYKCTVICSALLLNTGTDDEMNWESRPPPPTSKCFCETNADTAKSSKRQKERERGRKMKITSHKNNWQNRLGSKSSYARLFD